MIKCFRNYDVKLKINNMRKGSKRCRSRKEKAEDDEMMPKDKKPWRRYSQNLWWSQTTIMQKQRNWLQLLTILTAFLCFFILIEDWSRFTSKLLAKSSSVLDPVLSLSSTNVEEVAVSSSCFFVFWFHHKFSSFFLHDLQLFDPFHQLLIFSLTS